MCSKSFGRRTAALAGLARPVMALGSDIVGLSSSAIYVSIRSSHA